MDLNYHLAHGQRAVFVQAHTGSAVSALLGEAYDQNLNRVYYSIAALRATAANK